jgi:hypothetical protein
LEKTCKNYRVVHVQEIEMGEMIDKGHDIPPFSQVCSLCRHLRDDGAGRKCDAFPAGIPMEIWMGRNDHREAYPGDQGIPFEQVK